MNKIITGFVAAAFLASPVLASASVDITLIGSNPDTVRAGTVYVDPGYSAFSTFDGDLTSFISVSNVDTSRAGSTARTYSVTDSNNDTATAERAITVIGTEGTMPYCSGPMAPGWHVDLPGGGCGGTAVFIPRGRSAMVRGILKECPDWFPSGCIVN
jgi:hypothetical protein